VDRPALALLEYPLIVERLADAAVTARGAVLARELVPSPDRAEVARRQALTAEAVELLTGGAAPSLQGVADVRAEAGRAERGGSLEAG
jgi:DNA mismatch repair protein MutS2